MSQTVDRDPRSRTWGIATRFGARRERTAGGFGWKPDVRYVAGAARAPTLRGPKVVASNATRATDDATT
ncbi:MAG TPA: hypothetical protein VFB34_14035 [Chloroflexota bacterium]|nr:hypothetical protein [Chloroflexota bacterium]